MYDFDRIVKAAESCDFHDAFASDIKRCENALGMGGLMAISAECWLDVLSAMPDAEIAEYVHTKYKPGLLNPFKKLRQEFPLIHVGDELPFYCMNLIFYCKYVIISI